MAAENKKQPQINDVDDIMSKNLSRSKNAFQKETFIPALLGNSSCFVVKYYMPKLADIGRTKRLMELVVSSTRWKSRAKNRLWKSCKGLEPFEFEDMYFKRDGGLIRYF